MSNNLSDPQFFVYVVRNPDGKLYIGQTDNLPVARSSIMIRRTL